MFLKVKVQDTNIVINLGQDLTQASKVIAMFENNAQYIKEGYNELELLKPVAKIDLGDVIYFSKSSYNSDEHHLAIAPIGDVVGYVQAENYTFADVDKVRAKYKKTVEGLKKELELSKKKNDLLVAQLEQFTAAV